MAPAGSPADALALNQPPLRPTLGPSPIAAAPSSAEFDRLFAPPAPPFQVPPLTEAELPAHQAQFYGELGQAADGPASLHHMVGKHLEVYRYQEPGSEGLYQNDDEPRPVGVDFEVYPHAESGEPRVRVQGYTDIPAPEGMGGEWNPHDFAPHYVFAEGEDAFPVRPDLDGDGDLNDDAADSMEGTGSDQYRDGVIDQDQALSGAFTVTQKGEYTVLTYSNHYATNKAAHYHDKDYSTAQVYLQENAQGELEPAFLATSWHYGVQMTPWADVKKDASGHPVIQVGRGSHSLQPLGADEAIPEGGLHLHGDGSATMNGEDIGHRMTYDALQSNVEPANQLGSEEAAVRMRTLGYGSMAADPLMPELLSEYDTGEAVAGRLEGDIEKLYDEVRDPAARQEALLVVLDGVARAGAAGSQSYFDGMQKALEALDVDHLDAAGRADMRAIANLMATRGTAGATMRADALRLMAEPSFPPEVARHLTYAMQNGENNAQNLADALNALPAGAATNSPEAEAIRLVTEAIRPQEGDDLDAAVAARR